MEVLGNATTTSRSQKPETTVDVEDWHENE